MSCNGGACIMVQRSGRELRFWSSLNPDVTAVLIDDEWTAFVHAAQTSGCVDLQAAFGSETAAIFAADPDIADFSRRILEGELNNVQGQDIAA